MRQRQRQKRGSAVVEAAISLPLVMLVMLGSIELSAGLFQQHRLRVALHECAKIAAKGDSTGTDVAVTAKQLLTQMGFGEFDIRIDVIPRTVNVGSVKPATVTSFEISSDGQPTAGLDEVPRGTILGMTLTAPRPPVAGVSAVQFLGAEVSAQCVFVKEI